MKDMLHDLGRYVSGHVNELKNDADPSGSSRDVVITIQKPPSVHVRVKYGNTRK